jgi:hypothetical protein
MQQWPVGLSGLQLTLLLPLLLFNHATVASGTEWAAAHVVPATLAVQSCNSGQWDEVGCMQLTLFLPLLLFNHATCRLTAAYTCNELHNMQYRDHYSRCSNLCRQRG